MRKITSDGPIQRSDLREDRRIGVVLRREQVQSEQILLGISRNLKTRGSAAPLIFRNMPTGKILADDVLDMGVHGVILTSMPHPILNEFGSAITAAGIPCVQTLHNPNGKMPEVAPDYRAVGQMGFQHLWENNYLRLVFFHAGDIRHSQPVGEGFQQAAREHGRTVEHFSIGTRTRQRGQWQLRDQLADLSDLISTSEEPTGILASDDTHAERAVRAAELAGKQVPGDVAVVGVGDDQIFCEHARIEISSIALSYEDMGSRSVDLLSQLLSGAAPPVGPLLVPPADVIVRTSSDHTAVSDIDVDRCIQFIRNHIHQPIRVDDLQEHVRLSRSTLTRRFADALGHGPSAEISRLRTNHAKTVLRRTSWNLARVAVECGYGTASNFSHAFRKNVGMTPAEYRRMGHWKAMT